MKWSAGCGMVIALLTGSALGQPAQQKAAFWVYGQQIEDRASTRIGYWKTNANAGIGEVVLSYGRPVWKASYAEQLDQLTKGRMWRMGDNYWSLLDTNLPVRIGGIDVAPGLYYLAVRRSSDGAVWELVFIDPIKSRKRGLDSYDVGTRPGEIPVLFAAPLSFQPGSEVAERLTVLFKLDEGSQTRGRMRLTWGNLSLTAPVEVTLPASGG